MYAISSGLAVLVVCFLMFRDIALLMFIFHNLCPGNSIVDHLSYAVGPNLHRLVNTFVLGAAILAVGSGSRMQGSWLVNGDLDHGLYTLHLLAWSAIGVGVILHVLMAVKVGGVPLLLSIFSIRMRANDTPQQWPSQVTQFLKRR
jgi:hypothetical protein